MISQTVMRTSLWLAMGIWVGSWGFFAFVVSRIAFQVLPGDVAGDLAGSLLSILHFLGAAAALVAAGAATALGRRGLVVGLPVLLALLCLGSEIWLSPEVAAVRPSTLGPANTAETQQQFRVLHRLSLGLFLAIHLASVVLVGLYARLDARELSETSEHHR
jgi:hypothetical protein